MSSTETPVPISIHIAPHLNHLAVSLKSFLDKHPPYCHLVVGAFIFSPYSAVSPSARRLLLVQRSVSERSFPNCWEVPGGSCELDDPTVLHSIAREVFEETGLRLTRVLRQVGDETFFDIGSDSNLNHWLKLSFEIEVLESGQDPLKDDGNSVECKGSNDLFREADFSSIKVTLDPNEHQAYRWVSEEEIRHAGASKGNLPLISDNQKRVMLQAFQLHNEATSKLKTFLPASEILSANLSTSQ